MSQEILKILCYFSFETPACVVSLATKWLSFLLAANFHFFYVGEMREVGQRGGERGEMAVQLAFFVFCALRNSTGCKKRRVSAIAFYEFYLFIAANHR